MTNNPSDVDPPPPATKHTAIGVCLNLLLLTMIGYGYWQSEGLRWAWVLVGVPIGVVTLRYAWHLVSASPSSPTTDADGISSSD